MLQCLTSRQVAEWIAFSTLEPVGEPFPEDEESKHERERKQKRANIEGTLRAVSKKNAR